MELGSAINWAILLGVCVVPFIVMGQNRKNKGNKKLKYLTNLATQQDCHITKHEFCGDFVIGIDEAKKNVFFYKQWKDTAVENKINLAEIEICKVKNTVRLVSANKGSQNILDRIELSLIPADKSKKEILLEFFNIDHSVQLSDELQMADQWSKLINDCIKINK